MKLENAPLNLGVMCSIGPMRFVGFLAQFRRQHPGVALSMRETMPGDLLDLLIEGELDLAILARPEPLGERFDRLPLYREGYVAAFPQGHRFEGLNAVPLEAIASECLMSRANCEYHDYVGAICRARAIKAETGFSSEREDWIQSMVAAGIGICLFWEFSPTLPGVVTRPIVAPEIAREISLVWVAGRRFSPAATVFTRAIRSHPWGP
jgi:DNA-binding transcriptional LysR family regulator